jgi:hypothetical protein
MPSSSGESSERAWMHKRACQYVELVMNLLGAEGSRKLISDWAFQNLETREC